MQYGEIVSSSLIRDKEVLSNTMCHVLLMIPCAMKSSHKNIVCHMTGLISLAKEVRKVFSPVKFEMLRTVRNILTNQKPSS